MPTVSDMIPSTLCIFNNILAFPQFSSPLPKQNISRDQAPPFRLPNLCSSYFEFYAPAPNIPSFPARRGHRRSPSLPCKRQMEQKACPFQQQERRQQINRSAKAIKQPHQRRARRRRIEVFREHTVYRANHQSRAQEYTKHTRKPARVGPVYARCHHRQRHKNQQHVQQYCLYGLK